MINAKQTENLLKHISSRLAGREDCKKVNYKVTIDASGIHMNPIIQVYPNRHRRKEADKMDVIQYVHQYKMPHIKINEFVFGQYEYQLSADGKNRRWRKLN